MPKNSFLQAIFSGPKFSLAPIEKNNRGSLKIGDVVPCYAAVLNPREGIELNMSHLVRFMPAKAPVMEGYKVTFDAFAVPYSALGYAERKERDIDDFFNLKVNGGNIENPFCFPMSRIQALARYGESEISDEVNGSLSNLFRKGSLGDYLNMPSLKSVREHVRKWLYLNPFINGSSFEKYVDTEPTNLPTDKMRMLIMAFLNSNEAIEHSYMYETEEPLGVDVTFLFGCPFSISDSPLVYESVKDDSSLYRVYHSEEDEESFGYAGCGILSLFGYILRSYPAVASYYGFEADSSLSIQSFYKNLDSVSFDFLQVLYDNYGIDAQSIYDEYFEYVMRQVLYNVNLKNFFNELLFIFGETEGT